MIIFKIIYYAFFDLLNWIKNKEWKQFKRTGIFIYGGLFGCGKTLSMVRDVVNIYNNYDNIIVYSNVHLKTIPYIKFEYFEQLLDETPEGYHIIYCIDELGSIMNSRNYKSNKITESSLLLALNQIRHTDKLLFLCSQRFMMCDKVFRQVGVAFIQCSKIWRFHFNKYIDCYDLEYRPNLEPRILNRVLYFADNELYSLYDTKELVQNVKENFDKSIYESIKIEPDITDIHITGNVKARTDKKKLFRR